MISETSSAARSEAGMLNQTPSAPNQIGRMARKGNRKISCRESDRKMALFAMPILWKKLEMTIWRPMMKKMATVMRKPRAASPMSSSSCVKRETAARGKNIPTMKHALVTIRAHLMVRFSTSSTRSYCFAP